MNIVFSQHICPLVMRFLWFSWFMHFLHKICHPNSRTFSKNISIFEPVLILSFYHNWLLLHVNFQVLVVYIYKSWNTQYESSTVFSVFGQNIDSRFLHLWCSHFWAADTLSGWNIGKCQVLKHPYSQLSGRSMWWWFERRQRKILANVNSWNIPIHSLVGGESERSQESAISDKSNFPHHRIHSFQSFHV